MENSSHREGLGRECKVVNHIFIRIYGESLQGWSENRSEVALGGGEFRMGWSVVVGSKTMNGIVTSRGK